MIGTHVGNDEYSPFNIPSWAYEIFKEGPILELKYIIKDDDKPWTIVSSI